MAGTGVVESCEGRVTESRPALTGLPLRFGLGAGFDNSRSLAAVESDSPPGRVGRSGGDLGNLLRPLGGRKRHLALVDLGDAVPVEIDLHLVDQLYVRFLVDRVGEEFAAAEPQTQVREIEHLAGEDVFRFHDRPGHLVLAEQPCALLGRREFVQRRATAARDDGDEHGIRPREQGALVGVLVPGSR